MKPGYDKILIVLLLIICGILVINYPPWSQEPPAPRNETRSRLMQLAVLVRYYEVDYKTSIDEALSQVSKAPLSTRDRLILLLRKNTQHWKAPYSEYEKYLTNDAWGIPFNVEYTTNLSFGTSTVLSNTLRICPIVVWSSGPNHKNEGCHGDDIPWELDRINKDSMISPGSDSLVH